MLAADAEDGIARKLRRLRRAARTERTAASSSGLTGMYRTRSLEDSSARIAGAKRLMVPQWQQSMNSVSSTPSGSARSAAATTSSRRNSAPV